MAQYGDPYNPSSSLGRSPGSDGSSRNLGDATNRSSAPEDTSKAEPRPLNLSRRRNQWREHRYMTPDFGLPAAATTEPEAPPQPSRNAALPQFNQRPNVGGPPKATGTQASPSYTLGPSPGDGRTPVGAGRQAHLPMANQTVGRPLQMHPHSISPTINAGGKRGLGSGAGGGAARTIPESMASPSSLPPQPTTDKVTPLRRPLRQRSRLSSAPPSPAATATATTAAPGALRSRPRPNSPRRRMAKPPLPVLYLIRLVILGVGVAAIAGTLLSVLSPANVASPPGDSPSAGRSAPAAAPGGGLVQGNTANTVADLGLSSELTRLNAQLEQLATLTPGLTPVAFAVDLDTGRYVDLGGDSTVAAASTIKVPILIAFLQQVDAGTMALNQALVMQEDHMAGGSGTMRNDAVGTEYTALDVATRMIVTSDNTATNMMIDALGGQDALNQLFDSWGLEATVLRNPLPDLEGTNTTSTKDLALITALIDQGGLLTPRSRDRLFSIMQRTVNRSLIPFGINDGSLMANKTGDIGGLLGDVALVDVPNGKRYALSLLVQRPDNDGRASELIRRMTETIHAEMSQPVAPVGNPNVRAIPTEPGASEAEQSEDADDWETEPVPGVSPIPQERPPARDEIPQG
ncbi:serine hydrolase [Nodosilinea sp. P-1105]|uniref:serine hydrolase n=1 Tax=Nodosilinea sp. P-1105 TaxID=2546229 RepID=UPI00146B8EDE|nr:serine hydrolase [Nodosilinea sp. P-1105]NMF82165.1 serine hydrolase [Nodosilinea sp. P-1105]